MLVLTNWSVIVFRRLVITYILFHLLYIPVNTNGLKDSGSGVVGRADTTTTLRPTEVPDEDPNHRQIDGCFVVDGICISESDLFSYEAIKALHTHLDDDQSGDIDLSESVDFLREELNYTKGFEKRQKAFHHNNDQHVSVQELWDIWLSNEVHNWTVDQTVSWLHNCVELSLYADAFYENEVNGSVLPRLATNNEQFLSRILGIKNPTHRSKISIKAMDIVLFGPPKETGSLIKDIFIASLIFIIIVLLFKFKKMSSSNNIAFKKMYQEMEVLQEELLRFHEKKHQEENVKTFPNELKNEFESKSGSDSPNSNESDSLPIHFDNNDWDKDMISDIPELDQKLESELQLWLQLTYEKERLILLTKEQNIMRQIEDVKEMCEKLKPNRKNLFGALSFIHGKMEYKGQPVIQAREALLEIQNVYKEMEVRWTAIEKILGFNITRNRGIEHLQLILEPSLQASIAHSSSSAVGLSTNGTMEASVTETSPAGSPLSTPDGVTVRRRLSHLPSRNSVKTDFSSDSSPFPGGSIRTKRVITPLPTSLPHSYTVGSDLASFGNEGYRPRSASNESRVRKTSSGNDLGHHCGPAAANVFSTKDTGGSSSSSVWNLKNMERTSWRGQSLQSGPSAAPFPLKGNSRPRDDRVPSPSSSFKSSNKVSSRKGRLRLLGKSYSQDENESIVPSVDQSLNKFPSEPSLENEDTASTATHESDSMSKGSSTKKGFSKIISRLKTKSEKK